nr:putative reverse transcriptase domain-containing protein [Tanacetum cinerariifolium]
MIQKAIRNITEAQSTISEGSVWRRVVGMMESGGKWQKLRGRGAAGLGELAPTKLIVKLADRTIKCPKGVSENVLVGIDKFVFSVDFIVLDMLEDIKVPLILRRPFLSTSHAKIDVFKRKIALKIGNDKIVFKSEKPTSNIIKRVYTLGLRKRMKPDLEVMLMGEALILNKSLDHIYGDYIELNVGPTIEDVEVLNMSMPTFSRFYQSMSKKFFNSIMKDKIVFEGENVVRAFINVPIFVRNFSIITDFTVLENMDAYRVEGNGDIIIRFVEKFVSRQDGLME